MNIMAIEDGLFPLAYVTHTIKYLQQCKFSCSVENTLKQLAKLLQLIFFCLFVCFFEVVQYGGEQRWPSTTIQVAVDIEI